MESRDVLSWKGPTRNSKSNFWKAAEVPGGLPCKTCATKRLRGPQPFLCFLLAVFLSHSHVDKVSLNFLALLAYLFNHLLLLFVAFILAPARLWPCWFSLLQSEKFFKLFCCILSLPFLVCSLFAI